VKTRTYKLEVRRSSKDNRWRWHIVAPNGNITADCAQGNGYASRSAAIKAARRLQFIAPAAVLDS